ncbi:hypothetical protein D3C85_1407390 [compost metagenome]
MAWVDLIVLKLKLNWSISTCLSRASKSECSVIPLPVDMIEDGREIEPICFRVEIKKSLRQFRL